MNPAVGRVLLIVGIIVAVGGDSSCHVDISTGLPEV